MTATIFRQPRPQWIPTQPVYDAGQRANVHNVQGTLIVAGTPVQKPIAPATEAMYRFLLANFPRTSPQGLPRDSRRNHAVGEKRDLHEEGRAGDTGFSDRAVGEAVASWLVFHAQETGVQLVICYRTEWSSSNLGTKWEDYSGADDHTSHVHWELSPEAAQLTAAQMNAILNGIVVRDGGLRVPEGPPANPALGPAPVTTGPTSPRPGAAGPAVPVTIAPAPVSQRKGNAAAGALVAVLATAFAGWLIFGKS